MGTSKKIGNAEKIELLKAFNEGGPLSMFGERTVAAVRDCSIALIQRNRWEGNGIPFVKIGRSVRYKKKDILEYLENLQSIRFNQ